MEKVKLEEFNHWWINKKVDAELALPFKRDIYAEIEKHIDTLYDCILKHPHKHFLITKIGCGLANLNIFQVAPMFKKFISLSNCSLPKEFIEINSK